MRRRKKKTDVLNPLRFSVFLHNSNFSRQNNLSFGMDADGSHFNPKDFTDEKVMMIKNNPVLVKNLSESDLFFLYCYFNVLVESESYRVVD